MDDPLSIIHECTCIELFYEYKCHGILYQAHPDYLSMGAWYDWTMVTFVNEDSDISVQANKEDEMEPYFNRDEYASNFYCFFRVIEHPEIHAVVQSCSDRDTEPDSILFQGWNKEMFQKANQCYESILHAMSVESFSEHVLIIEDDPVVRE